MKNCTVILHNGRRVKPETTPMIPKIDCHYSPAQH